MSSLGIHREKKTNGVAVLVLKIDKHFFEIKNKSLPDGSDGKEPACNEGDMGSIPGLERFPWRREWQPTPVFLAGKSHGQRSLVGYSPWGRKESDTTERLNTYISSPKTKKILTLHRKKKP